MHIFHHIGVWFLAFIVFLGGMGWFLSPQDAIEGVKADAIIAISGDQGSRFSTARRLYNEGYADRILFSGDASDPLSPSNATVARQVAIQEGIPSVDILTEDKSRSTRENARNVARILQEYDFDEIILVTSPYHQRRAFMEFTWAAGDDVEILNYSVKDDDTWRRSQWWITPEGWYLTLSEGAKTGLTYVQHLFGSEPQETAEVAGAI